MTHLATCHCGATRITIPRLPETATACTCTFCTKRGALWGYFRPDEVTVETGDDDCVYAPSGVNFHHFCGRCGCSTWSESPDWTAMDETGDDPPQRVAVNLWLLEDVDVRALPVELLDGRTVW